MALTTLSATGLATVSSGRPPVGLAAGVVVHTIAAVVLRTVADRSARGRRRQVRAALTLLDAELAVGATEADALRAASAVAGKAGICLGKAAESASRGGDVASIFLAAGTQFDALAAAWQVRERCGAGLADIVGKVERDLAGADVRWREVDAAMAGPRSSAWLLAALPLVGVGLGSAMGAHPVDLLVSSGPGSILLLIGVLLDATGLILMQRLVRSGGSP